MNLTVREMQYCRDNLELDEAKVPRGLLDDTQLCAGGGEHNRDTCQVREHQHHADRADTLRSPTRQG